MGALDGLRNRWDYLTGQQQTKSDLTATYRKLPSALQDEDIARGYKEWRSENYWNSLAERYLPDVGLAFTVSPWVTAWEAIWGASPVQDLEKYKEMSQKVPYVYSALMLQANLTVARGFQVTYDGPEEVTKIIQRFVREHDFKNMLKINVYDMLRYGSSYIEVVRKWECMDCDFVTDQRELALKHISSDEFKGHTLDNPYGHITYLKILDPVYMRVRRNPWGITLGYLQLLTVPPVTLSADEIIQFRFNAMSDQYENAYGNSILRALLFHQQLIDEFERNMAGIMNTYLKPLLVVKIGKSEAGAPPVTDEQYRNVVSAFQNRRAATDIYVRQGGLIDDIIVIQPPVQGLQASEWWLRYLMEQREFELGVPRIFAGDPAGTNRATAQIVLQNFTTRLTNIQDSMSELIENSLFLPLMKENFSNWQELVETYGLPQLVWNSIVEEDSTQNLSIVSGLAKIGAITYDEARVKLGFPKLDEKLYGAKGTELIQSNAGMNGVGGFAVGDDAEEAKGQEKQHMLDDINELVDTHASKIANEVKSAYTQSLLKSPPDVSYGKW